MRALAFALFALALAGCATLPKPLQGEVNALTPRQAQGTDAIGATVLRCQNDGTPVTLEVDPPAPPPGSHVHYERMIRNICAEFRERFAPPRA